MRTLLAPKDFVTDAPHPSSRTDRVGSRVAHRLLPAAVLLPVLIGWVRLEGQRAGLYGTEVGLVLFALANAVCFTALILWTAVWLNRADAARDQATSKLRESEDRFRSLADALPQIVWATGADGTARYLNGRWSEYTGLPDAGPDASAQVIHPDDRRAMNGCWEKALRSETAGSSTSSDCCRPAPAATVGS